MLDRERVYFHTRGRDLRRSWPSARQGDFSAEFNASGPPTASPIAAEGGLYLAHSYGAIVATMTHRVRPAGALVLVEPALYDIARGHEAIEAHITAVESARAATGADPLWEYWQRIRPFMFGGPADPLVWNDERVEAEAFFRRRVPWNHHITLRELANVPLLVVTGSWNAEYEEIASRLARNGARHEVLEGHQHRPMDHPRFAELVDNFAAALSEARSGHDY